MIFMRYLTVLGLMWGRKSFLAPDANLSHSHRRKHPAPMLFPLCSANNNCVGVNVSFAAHQNTP